MKIILYKTATCPQCKIIKTKLEQKNIPFIEEMDETVMINNGIVNIPTLEVDGVCMDNIRQINNWVNAQEVVNG